MNKCVYHISGFDCPSCAGKSERHLNKHEAIEEAVIDFNNDRLYLTFKDKELSVKQIKGIIKEVEDDDITLSLLEDKKEEKFFNKENISVLIRIVVSVVLLVIGMTVLNKSELYWYSFGVHLAALLIISYDIFWAVILHIIHRKNIITEHLLMSLTALGAFGVAIASKDLNIYMESIMVMILYQIGKIIERLATKKSKDAISSAVKLRVETANKVENGTVNKVKPEELKVGDVVIVSNGEHIPTDGKVISGEGQIDTSSLTGEFVPVSTSLGLEVFSGCVVTSGSIQIEVTRLYKDSAVSKIIELISSSGAKKSKADEFVTKFARFYTPLILLASIIVLVVGGAITSDWNNWIILGLKMLVVGCPCAIVISAPLAYFASVGLASKNGIVIKGTNYLDKLVDLKTVITDKTGTLTKGVFSIEKVVPVNSNKEELLDYLVAAEYLSNHPIAKAIAKDRNTENLADLTENFQQIPGFGVSIEYKGELVLAGNKALLEEFMVEAPEVNESGVIVYVSKGNEYLGYVTLNDEVKEDAKEFVSLMKKNKVDVLMLTGDKNENARALAESLGITSYKGELLPDDKLNYLEEELAKKKVTAFIGDGINDAACIKEADIGFAMGAIGSDVAVESADVILMNDSPSKVYDAYHIAKIARHTALFNVICALTIKIGLEIAAIITSSLGMGEVIPMWLAVLADTGLTVILIINSLLILGRKIRHKSVK